MKVEEFLKDNYELLVVLYKLLPKQIKFLEFVDFAYSQR